MGRHQRPARVRRAGVRRDRSSGSASTTSTSTTSTASTTRRRSRRRSARWPSSSRRARCATSGSPRRRPRRSAAPTRCTRSPRCRPSTRCGGASPEDEILPTVRELGIGFVAVQPARPRIPHRPDQVASTTSTADDFRRRDPRFQGENFQKNLDLVETRRGDRAARRASPPRSWRSRGCSRRGEDIVPIPGTKRVELSRGERRPRVDIELTDEELRAHRRGVPKGVAAGDRYPDMSRVNR